MIAPASLIGFALVFIATTWAASTVLCAAVLPAMPALRRLGPRAERRAASIALCMPVALAAAVTASLVLLSAIGPSMGYIDHCLAHNAHLHLCLEHGTNWLSRWWPAVLIASLGGLFAVRAARVAHRWWRTLARLRALESVSTAHTMADGTLVRLAPSRHPFCFTVGVRTPRIYLGSATLDRLGPAEQAAVVAHERAHVLHGDVWRGTVLSLASLFGAPLLAWRTLAAWRDASERACDRRAADEVGSSATVASALLGFARAPACTLGCGFASRGDQLTRRIEAVLAQPATGARAARRISAAAGLFFTALVAAVIVLADPLHHALESVLGTL